MGQISDFRVAANSEPVSAAEVEANLGSSEPWDTPVIARGAGRSYGDSALSETLISTRYLDNFSGFTTSASGHTVLRCASGMSLEKVLETIIPQRVCFCQYCLALKP